jgi:Big-like domain-containing protein
MLNLRAGVFAAVLALVASSAGPAFAQTLLARRATTSAALFTFPGFFQGQPVVVRGTLATRDQPVLISPTADRALPLIFQGPSPPDGPVELRGSFWDVGRLTREDPRIQTLGLNRLLPANGEGDWPRPGEVAALIVTDSMSVKPEDGPPSLRMIALDPSRYVGQRVKITGQFRGRNLYGEMPQAPGRSQFDFVLHAADAGVWITGMRPRGRDLNLDIDKRVDTGRWLEATGVVREGRGMVWIEGQLLAATAPAIETRNAETLPAQLMGPPPEVIFSDPEEGETGVPLKAIIRLQFSRDMNPETIKGRVRWRYQTVPMPGQAPVVITSDNAAASQVAYDGAKRSLEIRINADEGSRYQDVAVQLDEGIAATDGAKLAPWKLSFILGGQ